MRTVSQISHLTGISVRTLHYYHEIGLLKPSIVTDAGYRLYDDETLVVLQQILFFKELDFTLNDIKLIMQSPGYDKVGAYKKQQTLLQTKRDKIDGLLKLLNKLVKGETCMSFKEFDMSDYFNALEIFKENHTDEVIKRWGSVENFNKMTETFKEKEDEIARLAIRQYGSIEKYTEAMKNNMENISALDQIKDNARNYMKQSDELHQKLVADCSKDVTSKEIQSIMSKLDTIFHEAYQGIDMGENFWQLASQGYLTDPTIIKVTDDKYGKGASEYIGRAYQAYLC